MDNHSSMLQRRPVASKALSTPCQGIGDVTNMMGQVFEEATAESLLVIRAGTNDVRKTWSEKLLDKYQAYPTLQNQIQEYHDLRHAP